MKTYDEVVEELRLMQVCLGGCGITGASHKNGFLFLSSVHWQERAVTKRGLRRFLLLVAKRDRLANWAFLNLPSQRWFHLWWDERKASLLAAKIGVRFPVEYSRRERLACLATGYPVSRNPAVYAWARRGL